MEKIATLTGHTYRVLFLSISPDSETIVTGAGDETLRFWKVFPNNSNENDLKGKSLLLPSNNSLRWINNINVICDKFFFIWYIFYTKFYL